MGVYGYVWGCMVLYRGIEGYMVMCRVYGYV